MAGVQPVTRGGHVLEADPRDFKTAEVAQQASKRYSLPILSIVRRASMHNNDPLDGVAVWEESLQKLGENKDNNKLGEVAKYGEVVLTLYSDVDIRRMLYKRVPDLFTPDKTNRLARYMQRLRGDYTDMVRDNVKTVTERKNKLIEERAFYRLVEFNTDFDPELYKKDLFPEPANPNTLVGLWDVLDMSILPNLEGFGESKLALALDPDEHIDTEIGATDGWLRSHKLDPNLVVTKRHKLQMPIFEYNPGFSRANFYPTPLPSTIVLDAPQMITDRVGIN